jgi:hypothetical protein
MDDIELKYKVLRFSVIVLGKHRETLYELPNISCNLIDLVFGMMLGLDPDIGEDFEGDFFDKGKKLLLKVVKRSNDEVTIVHLK